MWKATLGLLGLFLAGAAGHLAFFPLPEGSDGVVGLGAVLFYIPGIACAGYLLGLWGSAVLDRKRDPDLRRRDRAALLASVLFAAGSLLLYVRLA